MLSNQLILVYQIPKVASTALGAALSQHFTNVRVTHNLSSYVFTLYKQMIDFQGQGGLPVVTVKSIVSLVKATNEIQTLFQAEIRAGRRVKIITGVRDPIDLSISAMFHNFYTVTPFYQWMYDADPQATTRIFVRLIQKFFENAYLNVPCENAVEMLMREGVNITDWWFESEFNPALGIDLTQWQFDHQKGYAIISHGLLDILVFRFEDRSRILSEAVGNFVGIPNIHIPTKNAGEQKAYADLYKAVKSSFTLPEFILDRKYKIAYARHFYTPSELAAFRSRWSHKEITTG